MSTILFGAAAAICFVTAVLHVFVGGRIYLQRVLAIQMEPALHWMTYYSWHIGTSVLVVAGLGFAGAAACDARIDYAVFSTMLSTTLVLLAIAISLRARLPLRTFPIIPFFGAVILLGLVGILIYD